MNYFVNIIIGPAYFSCVGEGNLNLILKAQIMLGFLNLLFGFILGHYFSGQGVVVSWALSVTFSSFYLLNNYQKQKKIPLAIIFTKYNLTLLIVSFFTIITGLMIFKKIQTLTNIWIVLTIYMAILMIIYIPFFIKNKDVIRLKKSLFNKNR